MKLVFAKTSFWLALKAGTVANISFCTVFATNLLKHTSSHILQCFGLRKQSRSQHFSLGCIPQEQVPKNLKVGTEDHASAEDTRQGNCENL